MATAHVSRSTPTPATVAAARTHRQPYDQELPLDENEGTDTVTSTEDTAETRERQAPPVRLEDVTFGEITPAKPDTFGRRTRAIPEDHQLVKAFRLSYEKKQGLDVPTPDPAAMEKIIRRIAAQEGKGVSIKYPRDGVLSFFAQDRKKVVRKKPSTTTAASGE